MLLDIPNNFSQKLTEKYEYALKNDFLVFNGIDAAVEIDHYNASSGQIEDDEKLKAIEEELIDIEYTTFNPKKETVEPAHGTVDKNPFNKPEPELTIFEEFGRENEFKVVFNKFPLVPRHFMMVTNEFKPQSTPLSTNELVGVYSILSKLKGTASEEKNSWLAFYNCGPQSGASQPHKHVQFMTLPDKTQFTPFAENIAKKSAPFMPNDKEEPLQNASLPFAHFVAKLPDLKEMEADDLSMYFVSLLQRALTVIKENEVVDHISYNVLMTTEYMMVVPRSHSKYKGSKFGVNSCGYAGLILCREKEYLTTCKEVGPITILKELGFPKQAADHSEEFKY